MAITQGRLTKGKEGEMTNRKFSEWIRTLVCAGVWLTAGPLLATNFYVDPTAPGGGTGGPSDPFQTIGNSITAANAEGTGMRTIYLSRGNYRDVDHPTTPGMEDFSAQPGFDKKAGIYNTTVKVYGGYVGYNGGTPDWTEGTRVTRSTIIDLKGAAARAFSTQNTGYTRVGYYGITVRNANMTGDGGAIYESSSGYDNRLHVEDCLFENNTASGNGGAVFGDAGYGTPFQYCITNCAFFGNTAGGYGGALRYTGQPGISYRTAIEDCIFGGNTAQGLEGGGAVAIKDYVDMDRCIITNNAATHTTGRGGGVSGYASTANGNVTPLTFRQCTFRGNSATNGSAIAGYYFVPGALALENCLIVGNTAAAYTVFIAGSLTPSALSLRFCTIADNIGGGVRTDASGANSADFSITNCIIANNGATGITTDDPTPSIDYNDVNGHTANYAGTASAGPHDISQVPVFVGAGNYKLGKRTPCRDTGTNIGIYVDLVGVTRPLNAGYDMGCYETYYIPSGTIFKGF